MGEERSEVRSDREGASLETRSVARTTASSARSVVAKRNALERMQLEEEQKICDEMADAEKEARRLQEETEEILRLKKNEMERKLLEARHRREQAEADLDDEEDTISGKSNRTKNWVIGQNASGYSHSHSQSGESYETASNHNGDKNFNLPEFAEVDSPSGDELGKEAWQIVEGNRKTSKNGKPKAVERPVPKPRSKAKLLSGAPFERKTLAPTLTSTPIDAATSTPVPPSISAPTPVAAAPQTSTSTEGGRLDETASLLGLQSQQLAFQYLVGKRPKVFFKKGGKVDFEQYLMEFESAVSIPGLTPEVKLSELKFWFINIPGIIVSKFLLRKDCEAALQEAVEELKEEFGKRRTSPDEMLEELLEGDKIPAKDVDATDEFVAKLGAIYYLAKNTGREAEFNRRKLYETILRVKLPQYKFKWLQKWAKNENGKGSPLSFSNFLAYLNESRKLSETVSRCEKAGAADRVDGRKPATTPSATPATNTNARPGYGSSRRFTSAFENSTSTQVPTRTKFLPSSRIRPEMKNEYVKKNAFEMKSNGEAGYEARNQFYCLMCNHPHKLNDCPSFVSLSVDERTTYCKNNDVCFKCLGAGHRAVSCASRAGCSLCGESHHGALHGAALVSSLNKNASTFVANRVSFSAKAASASPIDQDSA